MFSVLAENVFSLEVLLPPFSVGHCGFYKFRETYAVPMKCEAKGLFLLPPFPPYSLSSSLIHSASVGKENTFYYPSYSITVLEIGVWPSAPTWGWGRNPQPCLGFYESDSKLAHIFFSISATEWISRLAKKRSVSMCCRREGH